jgi:hypothetical protein
MISARKPKRILDSRISYVILYVLVAFVFDVYGLLVSVTGAFAEIKLSVKRIHGNQAASQALASRIYKLYPWRPRLSIRCQHRGSINSILGEGCGL